MKKTKEKNIKKMSAKTMNTKQMSLLKGGRKSIVEEDAEGF